MDSPPRGITLTEILISVVIIAILAALALPRFGRGLESTRAHQAVEALRQIYTAERIYRTGEGFYYPHATDHSAAAVVNEINNHLSLRLEEVNWTYIVDTNSLNDFTAVATRNGGVAPYDDTTITLGQGGPPFAGTWPLPLPQE